MFPIVNSIGPKILPKSAIILNARQKFDEPAQNCNSRLHYRLVFGFCVASAPL
jgi:hypothetical protein